MASPNRVTVTLNGTKFNCPVASVRLSSQVDQTGTPMLGSLGSHVRVYVNFHDQTNLPFSALQGFFNLANVVTTQNIVPIKIEFWKDDAAQDALYSYQFNGWIQQFATFNPSDVTRGVDWGDSLQKQGESDWDMAPPLNHMLVMDLQVAMNQQNFSALAMSN